MVLQLKLYQRPVLYVILGGILLHLKVAKVINNTNAYENITKLTVENK